MARKIILKDNGLNGEGNAPSGYSYLGKNGTTLSEKVGATVSAIGGGSEYTETIVNISSAQILSMGTSPVELLPAPGVGKYYDIDKVIVEYNVVTTDYTLDTVVYLLISTLNGGMLIDASQLITGGFEYVMTKWSPILSDTTYPALLGLNTNGAILFATVDSTLTVADVSSSPGGDGTLRVKIYHKTVTFGA